jgi:hypothetical protein
VSRAIDDIRRAVEAFPLIMGGLRPPDWEILITRAILELDERIRRLEDNVPPASR